MKSLSRRVLTVGLLASVALAGIAVFVVRSDSADPIALPPPSESVAATISSGSEFVGAERCASCHAAESRVWRASTHGRAGGDATRDRVIAAFDGPPMRFANAEVTPRVDTRGFWFVVKEDGEEPRTYRVDGVIGGGHMEGGGTQGFVTRFGDGTIRFLPFDWSRQGRTWFCNTESRAGRGWVPISRSLRLQDCGDWPPARVLGEFSRFSNCQSCHASQLTVGLDSTSHRRVTRFTSLAINCESCHGPGGTHVGRAERGELATSAEIGYTALATLDKQTSVAICYQCHALKNQIREGFRSGDSLAAYYSVRFAQLGDRPLHPDGRVRTFAYQESQDYSDCYLNGGMTCTSCHDPHSQTYRDVTGVPLTGRFDDRQCTSCHASKGVAPSAHTHHLASSTGVRCTSCHMPYLQHPETRAGVESVADAGEAPVPYRRSDHSIAIPRPRADSALGIRSACQGCHAERSTAELDRQVERWWGPLKPVPSVVASQLRYASGMTAAEAGPLLLGTPGDTAGDRHAMGRFAGVSRYLESFGRPSAAGSRRVAGSAASKRLVELTRNPDLDVRAITLATLHLTAGSENSVRRVLAAALNREGARDAGLRARWSLALGFMGDRFAAANDLTAATVAYQRALEVTPRNAPITLGLANALRDAGESSAALGRYRESLAVDGSQPLAWVNLGIALSALGDTAGAVAALARATQLDPAEPIAWFNLANLNLGRGQLNEAARLYERAAALDPGLALAQFRLARVRMLQQAYPLALRALERGLAFDSSDATAREAREVLIKALRPR